MKLDVVYKDELPISFLSMLLGKISAFSFF